MSSTSEIDLLRDGFIRQLSDLASSYDRTVVALDIEGVLCPLGLPRKPLPPTATVTGRKGKPIFTKDGMDLLSYLSPRKRRELGELGKPEELNVLVCTASTAEYSPHTPLDIQTGIQERREAIRKRAGDRFRELPECIKPGEDDHTLLVFVSDEYDLNVHPPEQLINYLRPKNPDLDILLVRTPTLHQERTIPEREFWQSLNQGLKGEPRKIRNIIK